LKSYYATEEYAWLRWRVGAPEVVAPTPTPSPGPPPDLPITSYSNGVWGVGFDCGVTNVIQTGTGTVTFGHGGRHVPFV